MSRNLDSSLSAALSNGVIQPIVLAQITLRSGVQNVWSGVGDLVWDGKTFSGVGELGRVGAITEASAVQAEGTTVTLSGIGLSQVDIPVPSSAFTGALSPPGPGVNRIWVFPRVSSTSDGGTGSGSFTPGTISTPDAVSLAVSGTHPPVSVMDRGNAGADWGAVAAPTLPSGATVVALTPVFIVTSSISICDLVIHCSGISGFGSNPNGTFTGSLIPANLGRLSSFSAGMFIAYSGDGAVYSDTLDGAMAIAIDYTGTPPPTKTTLLYEAMNDVRIGGPAKIWYGLMSDGVIIGSPYLAFSGTVDKPTVNTSVNTTSITLALENRLINLQRANQRRYTAADQHLAFPDDLAFNWVELLNDMSLKEGQA